MKGGEKRIKRVLGKELMSTLRWGGMVDNNKIMIELMRFLNSKGKLNSL
jgi:hypothetical protein